MGISKVLPLVVCAGCSLLVDSSLDRLKCEGSNEHCVSGYTCLFDECVKNQSQKDGETCNDSTQCAEGLFCPQGIPLCSRPCNKIYDPNSECGRDHVCAPVADPKNPGKFTGGACVPVECRPSDGDALCQDAELVFLFVSGNPANRCVKLAANGGLCLLSCEVDIRKANKATGKDPCVSDKRLNPTHCGPVSTGDLVCLPAGNLLEGQACTLFPQSTSMPPDACGLNIVNNVAQLPLVCANRDGGVDGNVRCRIGACQSDDQCPPMQQCATGQGFTFCRDATEN